MITLTSTNRGAVLCTGAVMPREREDGGVSAGPAHLPIIHFRRMNSMPDSKRFARAVGPSPHHRARFQFKQNGKYPNLGPILEPVMEMARPAGVWPHTMLLSQMPKLTVVRHIGNAFKTGGNPRIETPQIYNA